MGAQSLRGHDTLHGTQEWEALSERWRQTLDDEYLTPDGSYAHIRSNHVGVSWDTGEVPGGHYFANGTHRFADILPDHARRAKALDLRGARGKMAALSSMVQDGRLELELPAEPERHRTRSSSLLPWIKVIGGARMVGDQRLVDAAIDASARQCATGDRWPDRPVSVGAAGLGSYMLLRWSSPLDLAALNIRGFVQPDGPILDDTDWDAVLVSVARCDDGVSLELVIEPAGADPVDNVPLSFLQLPAVAEIVVRSSAVELVFVADEDGRGACVLPRLVARERIVVAPNVVVGE
jgi:hypothetical protein